MSVWRYTQRRALMPRFSIPAIHVYIYNTTPSWCDYVCTYISHTYRNMHKSHMYFPSPCRPRAQRRGLYIKIYHTHISYIYTTNIWTFKRVDLEHTKRTKNLHITHTYHPYTCRSRAHEVTAVSCHDSLFPLCTYVHYNNIIHNCIYIHCLSRVDPEYMRWLGFLAIILYPRQPFHLVFNTRPKSPPPRTTPPRPTLTQPITLLTPPLRQRRNPRKESGMRVSSWCVRL